MLLWLLACTPDGGLTVTNDPPEAAFVAPDAGSRFAYGAPILLEAEVSDPQQATDALELLWSSTLGGVLSGEQTVSGASVWFDLAEGLPAGDHVITLQVLDDQGESAEATLALTVLENGAPTVHLISPSPTGTFYEGDPIAVEMVATDDGGPAALTLSWGGVAAGAGGPAQPDAGGEAAFTLTGVAAGSRTLSVSVVDAWGAQASDQVVFEVTDADADDDGHRALARGGDDCDDADRFVFPGADERCNGEDDDCDGAVDEGATDPETWYRDADGDGHGRASDTKEGCAQPAGYVFAAGDCDDADPDAHPGAAEACNGRDDDCDGAVPSAETTDKDADGYLACDDCEDAAASVHPGAVEACNGVDDDCDGLVPAGEVADGDGDGAVLCEDCADGDPARYPGATEVCDRKDNDCDGKIPANETKDADGDGFVVCEECDDTDKKIKPGAAEACDLVDQDCDGEIDEAGCTGCAHQAHTGHEYQFCERAKTWDDARTTCRGWGYTLVTLDDSVEQGWVHSVVNASHPQTWWIGYADQLVEGSWGWESGAPSSFTFWASGEPNNLGDEDCAEMNRFLDGRWNDAKCGSPTFFICEGAP